MVREIDSESHLAADLGAGDVFSAEQTETELKAIAKGILPASHGLELTSAQITVFRVAAEQFATEGEAGIEIVEDGKAPDVNLAAGVLNSEHAGARVSGEQEAQVSSDSGFLGDGLLPDEIEPIVCEP